MLAIIPARGGSKGIPRKNVLPFAGRPLLAHSIRHASQSTSVTRVVVSTDDTEIAAVADAEGAEVVWRPEDISGDTASSESALLHALDTLREMNGYEPDLVVFLQATSPVRRPDDVQLAIETLIAEEADSLLSVSLVHGFVWRMEADGPRSLSYDHRNRPRRQDAPVDVVENGSIYVFKPDVLRREGNRLGGRVAVYRQDPLDSFQIDEPGDFSLLEALHSAQRDADEPDLTGIRLLVLDFDGVLTDNRVTVHQDGRESVVCHRGDGWGIARLREAGVDVMILSTEVNPVVSARAKKLRIECTQACDDKRTALQELSRERGLTPNQIAFMGNDHNDLEGLNWVGMPISVADGAPEVRAAARLVTQRTGGDGAVREVCEAILAQRRAQVGAEA
ncbi:MAG: acylneuraminate cytidylyltransferase [Bacteroidota bacterium]